MTSPSKQTVMGLSGKIALVHKDNEEGGLQIDAITGVIISDQEDRPEWASGLAVAQLSERHAWYNSRLGEQYTKEHQTPDLYNFADLGWLGVDEEGELLELEADPEFRMEVLGAILGTDREASITSGEVVVGEKHTGRMTVAEMEMDRQRTPEELAALEEAQNSTFEELAKKSGTNG